jgi:hypothetical protein
VRAYNILNNFRRPHRAFNAKGSTPTFSLLIWEVSEMPRLCEDFHQIDVRKIDLQHGSQWQYPPPGGIALIARGEGVRVIKGAIDCQVRISHTKCNYGGQRPWFLCPECDRRCLLLYFVHDGFGCRRCMRLVHTSATECELDRRLRKMNKLLVRLREFDARPKWKRWRTFEQVYQQRVKAEREVVLCTVCRLTR